MAGAGSGVEKGDATRCWWGCEARPSASGAESLPWASPAGAGRARAGGGGRAQEGRARAQEGGGLAQEVGQPRRGRGWRICARGRFRCKATKP